MGSDGMADVLSFLSSHSAEQAISSPVPAFEPPDESLLAEASTGSKEALAILFRRYRRAVLNVAKRILRDESEAEDLCQEVFLQVFQKAKLFDAKKGSASSWIIQIAYHRAVNRRHYLTHRLHYQPTGIEAEQIGVQESQSSLHRIDARALLDRLRDQLTFDQQRTLELFFFEGYSLREIGEIMNQPIGNVRHHYYRALERLRTNVFPEKND
jgi:RNA polymerase sigma-70 factor (ECF subfamily)